MNERRKPRRSRTYDWDDEDDIQYELDDQAEPPQRDPPPPMVTNNADQTWLESFRAQSGSSFTVADILIVTAFGAAALTLTRFVPLSIAAAAFGLASIVGLGILSSNAPRPRLFLLFWWMLLLLYLIVSVMAIAKSEA